MIYFLVPVFNESPNIEGLAASLKAIACDQPKFFVLVDDCSSDDTIAQIHRHFGDSDYQVLDKASNRGPGHSFNLGFGWILRHGSPGDRIVTLEGDNTSDVSSLGDMLAISGLGYDLVLASVYAQGGSLGSTTVWRKTISFVANALLRSVFDIRVATLTSFYRVYGYELLGRIQAAYPEIIEEAGYISMTEVLIKAIRVGARIIEVPTRILSEQRAGQSKMKIVSTALSYLRFLQRDLRPRGQG